MTLSSKALQKKREKKKKKRVIVKALKNQFHTKSNYSSWSIHECFIPTGLWEAGIGHVILSRKDTTGEIAVGVYLVDIFCLGVKNCFLSLVDEYEYHDMLNAIHCDSEDLQKTEAIYVNTLITQAIRYAKQFGFNPHRDFSEAKKLLINIPIDVSLAFNFGSNGKPLYVQGPNESSADIKRILKTLHVKAGEGCYDFVVEAEQSKEVLSSMI